MSLCFRMFVPPQCFEGMKAYKDVAGNVRLFRPELNIRRLNASLARLHFPTVDENTMIELIRYENNTKLFGMLVRGYPLFLGLAVARRHSQVYGYLVQIVLPTI